MIDRLRTWARNGHVPAALADDLKDAADKIEWLQGMLADKDYIRALADYQRGHLSYAGQLEARERQPVKRTK